MDNLETQATLGTRDTVRIQHWEHRTQYEYNIGNTGHSTNTTLGTQDTVRIQHWEHRTQYKYNKTN
jgi:protein involved in polysaccharide export with SLBB domain